MTYRFQSQNYKKYAVANIINCKSAQNLGKKMQELWRVSPLGYKASKGQLNMHGVDKRDNTHHYFKTIIQRRQDLRERLMNYLLENNTGHFSFLYWKQV